MSQYKELGVDVKKRGIEVFRETVSNLYPRAFCVVQRDPEYPEKALVLHTDSAGSKPVQAYLHYRETGDPDWFTGIAQDSLAMNLNDVVCVGAKPVSFVDYVAVNTLHIDRGELLGALSRGFNGCVTSMQSNGVPFQFAGGETADLPDLVRTVDVSVTMLGRADLSKIFTGEEVQPGDKIIGVRSGGPIRYEKEPNSGIMSNGFTLARSVLMKPSYVEKYPELTHRGGGRYRGRYSFDDHLDELGCTVGEALLSPTRLYAPIALNAMEKLGDRLHGMVHCTGGGQTKILRIGSDIHYTLNSLPEPDPVFKLMQREGKVTWREMYTVFNMGVGFEMIVSGDAAHEAISVAERYGVEAQVIGECSKSKTGNTLTLESGYGKFSYT